jgi:hypothetical protein
MDRDFPANIELLDSGARFNYIEHVRERQAAAFGDGVNPEGLSLEALFPNTDWNAVPF